MIEEPLSLLPPIPPFLSLLPSLSLSHTHTQRSRHAKWLF